MMVVGRGGMQGKERVTSFALRGYREYGEHKGKDTTILS